MQRRDFMGTLAALAASRRTDQDYSLADLEDAEPDWYTTARAADGEIPVHAVRAFVESGHVFAANAEEDSINERDVEVYHDRERVHVAVNGRGDRVDAGLNATFDPEAARDLAAAIYQAAEDIDARTGQ